MPNIVISSLWRSDENRHLIQRAEHLLAKQPEGGLRWVWVVGDSEDETEKRLRWFAKKNPKKDIEIIRHDTGILGDEPRTRLRRLSQTVDVAFSQVREADDFWIHHESDLKSSPELVSQFLNTGKCPLAGWVTLGEVFYDTWGYTKNGNAFTNDPPYHSCYNPDEPFQVDSIGSVFMLQAEDLRAGVRCGTFGVRELCEKLRGLGREIWVDPRIAIVQPLDLWVAAVHA